MMTLKFFLIGFGSTASLAAIGTVIYFWVKNYDLEARLKKKMAELTMLDETPSS